MQPLVGIYVENILSTINSLNSWTRSRACAIVHSSNAEMYKPTYV